jgi:hypothetical protein
MLQVSPCFEKPEMGSEISSSAEQPGMGDVGHRLDRARSLHPCSRVCKGRVQFRTLEKGAR